MTTRVLIVDDSAVVRQVLSAVLSGASGIEVMGTAPDPIKAMTMMQRAWPDVIVVDIEMPRMDGLTFVKQVMGTRPTPIVVCSSLVGAGAKAGLEALAAGAVTAVAKPTSGLKQYLEQDSGNIVAAVRTAATGRARRVDRPAARLAEPAPARRTQQRRPERRVVAIGTSTGGTQALERVLTVLPSRSPAVVVVQHMPEKFTAAFAERMNTLCAVDVREAADGDRVQDGLVLVAPGGRHMELLPDAAAGYRVRVFDGPPVNRHRPSVDVLFRSVARAAGADALGVIMTGMGDDGARGLLEMRQAGAVTVAQDEATCVVYGMPKEAVALGAAEREVPLPAIAEVIRNHG
ncbi:chemotaxis response regulator protein-glutamate methylesterase [Dactylosporangium sp. NPDC051541]|uniref:chemotaxis response regulator protein-glutamate methylesterase n=1 Tax=Dactylosporangium sp. NPDC051541 TaxID=3363977 RepID=UPI0037962EAD